MRQQAATFPVIPPLAYRPIGLPARATEEGAFNCSLHLDGERGFRFAYRAKWTASDIRTGRLTDDYKTVGPLLPAMVLHERATVGREDPRLFRFRGDWYVAFTGFEKREYFCSVLYAKLDSHGMTEDVIYPHYERRQHGEKNWGFFECDNELHAVYEIGPNVHRVFHIDNGRIGNEHVVTWNAPWTWGQMRGGASPQRVGDEFYSWFHGYSVKNGNAYYTLGLYTFEARPPFRPLRMIKEPLVIGGFSNTNKYVFYPCGSALKAGRWHISAGEHDSRCSIVVFDAEQIESHLQPVFARCFKPGELREILSLNGWCTEAKAIRISELVAGIPSAVQGVEIGVFAGRSLFAAAAGARANPHGGFVLGIDSYSAEENLRGVDTPEHRRHWPQQIVDDAQASMWATRQRMGLAKFCDVMVSKSADAHSKLPFERVNYLHIDGNHSKEGAVGDVHLYLPLVEPGGVVVVDDTHPQGKDEFLDGVAYAVLKVQKACDLIEDHHNWRVYRKR